MAGQPSSARAATRFRQTLVTGQIALSMALLVAAGLFIKSLRNVTNVDLGLDMENITTFEVAPELNGYEPERSQAIFARLEEELAAIPGVTGVSAAMVAVLSGSNWGAKVSVEGWESGPDIDSNSRLNNVGPGFFSILGIPLMAGREFTAADAMGAPRVAVVNEAFTRKFNLNGREAVGKWMSTRGGGSVDLDIQIVGVVQDARYASVKQDVPPLFFTPYKQNAGLGDVTFYVRSALEGSQVLAAIPALVAGIDPNLPVDNLKTLEQQVWENVYLDRLIGTLSAAFATLATLLAAVGLYGVLAYTVAQRTREIGVRMALGARSHNVRAMVMKQVSQMTAIGGIIGIVGAYFIGRFAQSLLYGLDGSDPFVMVGVVSLLAIVAFSAGHMPARKRPTSIRSGRSGTSRRSATGVQRADATLSPEEGHVATSNVPSRTVPAFAQASAAVRRAGLAALMVVSVFLPRSPAAAQAVDRGISVIGGLAYGALSGALVGVSYVTLRANVWDRYVPGKDLNELAKNALTPWVIGGAIVSAAAIQIKFDDGASAGRALRETLEGAVVGALAGWVMGLPHDKTAGAIIGLGAGALVSAAVVLIDPGTSKDGREMGLFGGAPVLLFRWWF